MEGRKEGRKEGLVYQISLGGVPAAAHRRRSMPNPPSMLERLAEKGL
jgi:hypothetical protein